MPSPNQIDAFAHVIAPTLIVASETVLDMQHRHLDPALYAKLTELTADMIAISRHIYRPGGANNGAMRQLAALAAKVEAEIAKVQPYLSQS